VTNLKQGCSHLKTNETCELLSISRQVTSYDVMVIEEYLFVRCNFIWRRLSFLSHTFSYKQDLSSQKSYGT